MPRPKGSKNVVNEDVVFHCDKDLKARAAIALLDASKPDLLSINNEVRASIRETRKKVNEIINILNGR